MARSTWTGWAVLSVVATCWACGNRPAVTPIVGPDGTRMAHVRCGSDQALCFKLAGQLCPSGYRFKPLFDPQAGNFLVRCRDDEPAQVAAVCPVTPEPVAPAKAAAAPSVAPAREGWPPANEPWPEADPWPQHTLSGSGGALPASAPRAPSGSVDVGY